MSAFDDIVSSILFEMKSPPRLVEANPDIYEHIKNLYKPFMKKMREYMTQDLVPNKHYKTNIRIKIHDPYTKKDIVVPIYVKKEPKKEDGGLAFATYNNKERYILIYIPAIIDELLLYRNQEERFSRLIIHELTHIIDPSFITIDKINRNKGQQTSFFAPGSNKYYLDRTEINAFSAEIIYLVKKRIAENILTKEYVMDLLRRGGDGIYELMYKLLEPTSLNFDELEQDSVMHAVDVWLAHYNPKTGDHIPKFIRELGSRLYGVLQAGA